MCQTPPKKKRRSRKRCPFCGDLFWPDRRTRKRQWACSKSECQKQRRSESQRRWRAKNPEDAVARRYRREVSEAEASTLVPPRLPHAQISPFPWDEAKDVISPQVYVTLKHLVLWQFRHFVDVISPQLSDIAGDIDNSQNPDVKDEIGDICPPL